MFLWRLIYPLPSTHEEDFTEIQPTYENCRFRSDMLRQIKKSNFKLKKTFILSDQTYQNTTRRNSSIKRRAKLPTQPLQIPTNLDVLDLFI